MWVKPRHARLPSLGYEIASAACASHANVAVSAAQILLQPPSFDRASSATILSSAEARAAAAGVAAVVGAL